jgi:uncharacterized integral membrane protein
MQLMQLQAIWPDRQGVHAMKLKLTIINIVMSFSLLFIIQNARMIDVDFLLWTIHISFAVVIFVTLVIGFFLGWVSHGYRLHRQLKAKPVKQVLLSPP